MVTLEQPKTVEDCLKLQAHFIGIPKITVKNAREFYRRGKTIEILGVGFLEPTGRMPTYQEVTDHIGLEVENAPKLDTKKWNNVMIGILNDITNQRIKGDEDVNPSHDVQVPEEYPKMNHK